MVTGWRLAVSTLSSTEAKAGCGCSAGGVFPGVLPGMGTQQCWGRTRRGNGSSEMQMSQLAQDHVPQRPADRNDPALAVVFPGKVGYGYKTSLGKAKNNMPIKLFIFSKQGNIIESDREYMVLPLQCIPSKTMKTKQIAKEIQILRRKRRGRKRREQEEKEGDFFFFCITLVPGAYLPFPGLPWWDGKWFCSPNAAVVYQSFLPHAGQIFVALIKRIKTTL